jgi:hypothetical protein
MPGPAFSPDAKMPSSWLKVLWLAVLFCCINGRICFAATYTVTQNQELSFGIFQIPPGFRSYTVQYTGASFGSGTLLYGIPAPGDYTIKCTSGCGSSISIDLQNVSSNCTGLSIFNKLINYNNGEFTNAPPGSGLSDPGGSGKDLKLGATAGFDSTVPTAACTPTFDIVINATHFAQTASIGFDVALSRTKNSDINVGTVSALNASTYRVSTAGVLSTVSGTGTSLYGTTTAGNIKIVGSTADGITISAGGYTVNNGVTPSNAQCSYNGGAAAACAMTGVAPGSGKTLLVGVDVATDGTQAGGTTAAPAFTISVAYQ